jgi:hypothetical protein
MNAAIFIVQAAAFHSIFVVSLTSSSETMRSKCEK